MSTLIAGALRRALAQAEQDRLDIAVDAQNEENRAFGEAYAAAAASILAGIEW